MDEEEDRRYSWDDEEQYESSDDGSACEMYLDGIEAALYSQIHHGPVVSHGSIVEAGMEGMEGVMAENNESTVGILVSTPKNTVRRPGLSAGEDQTGKSTGKKSYQNSSDRSHEVTYILPSDSEGNSVMSDPDDFMFNDLGGLVTSDSDCVVMSPRKDGLMAVLNDLPDGDWSVNASDSRPPMAGLKAYSNRYYDSSRHVQCRNCDLRGHLSRDCPTPKKKPVCHFCGKVGHNYWRCADQFCFNCDGIGHQRRDCPRKSRFRAYCGRCQRTGHSRTNCPELWRQYHATVDACSKEPVRGTGKVNRRLYCANCGDEGHLYSSCPSGQVTFWTATQLVYSYDIVRRPAAKSGWKENVASSATEKKEWVRSSVTGRKEWVTSSATGRKEKVTSSATERKERVTSSATERKKKVASSATERKENVTSSATGKKEKVTPSATGRKEKVTSSATEKKEKVTSSATGRKEKVALSEKKSKVKGEQWKSYRIVKGRTTEEVNLGESSGAATPINTPYKWHRKPSGDEPAETASKRICYNEPSKTNPGKLPAKCEKNCDQPDSVSHFLRDSSQNHGEQRGSRSSKKKSKAFDKTPQRRDTAPRGFVRRDYSSHQNGATPSQGFSSSKLEHVSPALKRKGAGGSHGSAQPWSSSTPKRAKTVPHSDKGMKGSNSVVNKQARSTSRAKDVKGDTTQDSGAWKNRKAHSHTPLCSTSYISPGRSGKHHPSERDTPGLRHSPHKKAKRAGPGSGGSDPLSKSFHGEDRTDVHHKSFHKSKSNSKKRKK